MPCMCKVLPLLPSFYVTRAYACSRPAQMASLPYSFLGYPRPDSFLTLCSFHQSHCEVRICFPPGRDLLDPLKVQVMPASASPRAHQKCRH